MALITSRAFLRVLIVLILTPLLGLGVQPHLADRGLRRAQHALENGMSLAAAQHLAQAADLLPSRPELWEQAGSLALEGGDAPTAVRYFEQAASRSLSTAGQLQLGDAYLQSDDTDSAIRIWENLSTQAEPDPAALERLVSAYLGRGDFPATIASLQALSVLQPGNAQYHYQLGLLVATQDPEAALAYLTRAAELDPNYTNKVSVLQRGISATRLDDEPAYRLMGAGRSLAGMEEWSHAAEAFRQATILRPDYAEAWAYYGEALQHLPANGQSQAVGLTKLRKALEIDPTSLSANTFLALFWQRRGRYDRALEAIHTAVAKEPKNPVLLVEMGYTLALQGDLEAAYQAYLQSIQLAPQDARYYNYLVGFTLSHDYHITEIGLPAARQAVLLSPDDPVSLDTMAQVLLQLEDRINAKRFLNRAIQTDSLYAPAHLHLGMLYILQNQYEQAYAELTRTVSLAPHTAAGKQAQQLLSSAIP